MWQAQLTLVDFYVEFGFPLTDTQFPSVWVVSLFLPSVGQVIGFVWSRCPLNSRLLPSCWVRKISCNRVFRLSHPFVTSFFPSAELP